MGLDLYLDGFFNLMTCRPVGFGISPLPLTSILEYCCFYSIIGEQRADFVWVITELDKLFVEWARNNDKS